LQVLARNAVNALSLGFGSAACFVAGASAGLRYVCKVRAARPYDNSL
jgi:hypothetical protein